MPFELTEPGGQKVVRHTYMDMIRYLLREHGTPVDCQILKTDGLRAIQQTFPTERHELAEPREVVREVVREVEVIREVTVAAPAEPAKPFDGSTWDGVTQRLARVKGDGVPNAGEVA